MTKRPYLFVPCLLLFFMATDLTYAQTRMLSGIIRDKSSNEVLPFANITYSNHSAGTSADINGRFTLEVPDSISEIEISYVGYDRLSISDLNWTGTKSIYMEPLPASIAEVVIFAGENPALRIIRNAINNRSKNDPEQLKAFRYKAYNKFVMTTEKVDAPVETTLSQKEMESDEKLNQFFDQSYLLAMESLSERFFKYPRSSEEVILATKVSGLKDPQFSFLATEIQSFSIYKDFVRIIGVDYLNPLSKPGLRQYFYELQDTTYSGKDTVFVVAFRPQKKADIDKLMTGVLYINSNGWAVQNTIAQAAKESDTPTTIHQVYEAIDGRWFPVQLNYEMRFKRVLLNQTNALKAIGRSQLSEIEIEPDLSGKKFSGLDVIIDPLATKNIELLQRFRDSTDKEKVLTTYTLIDSISTKFKIENRMMALSQLSEGLINWNYMGIDLNRILRINGAENVRLGIGLYTNDRVSRKWSVGAWAGYGFRDKSWKYGFSTQWRPNAKASLEAGYEFELYETGGIPWLSSRKLNLSETDMRKYFVFQMDEVRQWFGTFSYQIRPKLQARLHVQLQDRIIRGDYRYDDRFGGLEPINRFNANILSFQLDYTPKTRFIQTAYKRLSLENRLPLHQLSIKRGFHWFDGHTVFNRLDWKSVMEWTVIAGMKTSVTLQAGYVDRPVPASFLFYGMSNRKDESSFFRNILLGDRFSFETLFFNEMLMDVHGSVIIHQEIIRSLYKSGKSNPGLEIALKGLWGNLQMPEYHRNVTFNTPVKGYYEAGILINRLFQSMGLGAYTRFGPYQLEHWYENMAIRLTFRL
jgi:hypothetical protein